MSRSGKHTALVCLSVVGIWTPITAMADGPEVSLTPSSLDFGQVVIGSGFGETVFLMNTGTATLHASSISASAGFVFIDNGCPADYPAGTGCGIGVGPLPQQPGLVTGELTIIDDAPGSPHIVPLREKATYLRFSPTNLGFGSVFPGQRLSRGVSVTNTGSATISITGMSTAGPSKSQYRIEGDNCGSSLVGGATCNITVAFAPSVYGKSPAAVLLGNSQEGSPDALGLTGNATQVNFDPAVLNFGRVGNGGAGPSRTVTVTNLGDETLHFLSFQVTGPAIGSYVIQGNTCGASLAPHANCTITVQVFAAHAGRLQATLSISDDGAASPQSVLLIAHAG